ncbi:hypothetical protein N7499_005692 [Penicillium canescens]|nr:hypothetical protein N7499_005692 [Penicillium canescens]KAJ6177388.1 hypothetical protein N7485_004302 [Penicillium canescens]
MVRASNGEEFAEELFSTTSNGKNLPACLPNYRWVFPTSCDRYSTTFQEDICSWFDAYFLGDINERQGLQKEGLTQSVFHILNAIEEEANLLKRRLSHVYLGGVSQGMATALLTFFAAVGTGRIQRPLGGLLALCGWLPFAQDIEGMLCEPIFDRPCTPQALRLVSRFFFDEISAQGLSRPIKRLTALFFPLRHGTDDAWTSGIIRRVMTHVECHQFTGAESDGHWIKEPEGFDQILQFLQK